MSVQLEDNGGVHHPLDIPPRNSPPSGLPTENTRLLVEAARGAYKVKDVHASKLIHQLKLGSMAQYGEQHDAAGDYVKAMIFGGLDGILTSFAIVAGAAGGNLGLRIVLVLGFSNIFADAFSMGMGEFLSTKAHNEFVMGEREREEWELDNNKEGEIQEMVEIYVDRGMTEEDAETIVRTMAKYDQLFINIMMVEELGLQVPEAEDTKTAIKEGIIMFFSFAGFGAMPLLGYTIVPLIFPHLDSHALFIVACGVTAITLFVMGAIKSKFSSRNWVYSGVEMLLLGGCCAVVAYEIGSLMDKLVGQ